MGKSYLKFKEKDSTGKTKRWGVYNIGDDCLGYIDWYSPWRQYCFQPLSDNSVFSSGCLSEITNFINEQMKIRKGVKEGA